MKVKQWLAITKNGISKIRKTKPALAWNEIAVQIEFNIPDELFQRPIIAAKLDIKDIPVAEFNPQIIVDTAELVAQQTGAKIEFSVVYDPKKDE